MDPETRKDMVELLELTRENNKMLRKMRSAQKWASFVRFVYWVVVIAALAAAYYYLQPYTKQLEDLYNQDKTALQNLKNI